MKILLAFGTRPEAIKFASVYHELKARSHKYDLDVVVCITGQHRHMLDQVLELFDIPADYDLDVMVDNQTPTQVTAAVMSGLEPILHHEEPDWVLVQGDTVTAAAAALTAFFAHRKIGHIEAGLRTGDKFQPFPEEIDRRIITLVADLNFAPTPLSRTNLLNEHVPEEQIIVTGNTVIDALLMVTEMPYEVASGPFAELPWDKRLILVTAHRRENFGTPLENICDAIIEITSRHDNVHIVYPVHKNRKVQEPVHERLGNIPSITLLPPLDYHSLVHLMKRCTLILTDSGGIQEEAPSLGIPVLVLRGKTERPEGVEAGTVMLVGTDRERIVFETSRLLTDPKIYDQMARAVNPYGDGQAAGRIVDALRR